MRRRRSPGFTLLELLAVLVIIGLLVGYVGPRYFAQIDKSKVKVVPKEAAIRQRTSTSMMSPNR